MAHCAAGPLPPPPPDDLKGLRYRVKVKGAAVLQGISATTRLKATLVKGTVVVATQRASSTDGVEKLMIAYPESAAGGWASALHFEALFVDKKSDEEDKVAADPVLRAQALAYRELQREAAKRDVDARGDPTYGMPLTTTDVTPFLPGRFGDLGSKVSMLHVHAEQGDTARVEQVLLGDRETGEPGPPVDLVSGGWTALHCAASRGHVDTMDALVRNGADSEFNACGDYCHGTPLIIAAQKSQLHAVRRLLHLKVNVNARTLRSGETALHKACFDGDAELVRVLLSAGADPSITDNDGESAFDCAEKRDFPRCAALVERSIAAMA